MTNKFKFGDKVSYRSCKNAFYLQETDDIRSLIAVEKFGAIKGAVITVITNELTPASDWVKCSERMPQFGIEVLVFDGCDIEKDHVDVCAETCEEYFVNYGDTITHWMPLPTPPQAACKEPS